MKKHQLIYFGYICFESRLQKSYRRFCLTCDDDFRLAIAKSATYRRTVREIHKSSSSKRGDKLKTALQRAANVLGNLKDSHLGQLQLIRRVAFRKGRVAAIIVIARRCDVIIWGMVVNKVPYRST